MLSSREEPLIRRLARSRRALFRAREQSASPTGRMSSSSAANGGLRQTHVGGHFRSASQPARGHHSGSSPAWPSWLQPTHSPPNRLIKCQTPSLLSLSSGLRSLSGSASNPDMSLGGGGGFGGSSRYGSDDFAVGFTSPLFFSPTGSLSPSGRHSSTPLGSQQDIDASSYAYSSPYNMHGNGNTFNGFSAAASFAHGSHGNDDNATLDASAASSCDDGSCQICQTLAVVSLLEALGKAWPPSAGETQPSGQSSGFDPTCPACAHEQENGAAASETFPAFSHTSTFSPRRAIWDFQQRLVGHFHSIEGSFFFGELGFVGKCVGFSW
jgi:hypothetical protein